MTAVAQAASRCPYRLKCRGPAMETELAGELRDLGQEPPGNLSPTWEALWPPRTGAGPEPQAKPAPPSAAPPGPPAHAPASITNEDNPRELGERLELKIAELLKVIELRQAELAEATRSELEAVRASVDTALASALAATESEWAEREARLEHGVAAVAGRLSEQIAAVTATAAAASARLGAMERDFREETRTLAASIEVLRTDVTAATAASTSEARAAMALAPAAPLDDPDGPDRPLQRLREVEANLEAVRSELAAAVADQAQARAEDLERDVARHAALEIRLRADLHDIVGADLATRRLGGDDYDALAERLDRVDGRMEALTGELAQPRSRLTSTEATSDALGFSAKADAETFTALRREVGESLSRLSGSLETHRAETVSRADLATLEEKLDGRVAEELTSGRSQLDARLTKLDAVVDAVDEAAASLRTSLEERLTGAANVAASTALAPMRSDLRSVHAQVAATQKSIRELRRRIRMSVPPPPT